MNKNELIAKLAEDSKLSKKDAEVALNSTLKIISDALSQGDAVQLIGFGTFSAPLSAARTSKNPRTGEAIDVPARHKPKFVAGAKLKAAVQS